MDAAQRAAWRTRLAAAYGSWLCPICKVAYASQAQFEAMAAGGTEMVRHSECGHVIMWRGGGADFIEPYLAEPRMPELPPPPRRGMRRW